MKNFIKLFAVVIGAFLLLFIFVSLALYFFLPLNKIKDFAAVKLSEQLHREVKIKSVSFNLFSGIKLKGLAISNRKGYDDRPFISADSIELRYAFWPLFSGKIIIPEISLVKPEIMIERSRRGDFNFSDMLAQSPPKKPKKETKAQSLPPIDLIVNTFSISKGKITYLDYASAGQNELKSINLKISGITLAALKPIEINASATGRYQSKNIPIALSGKIGVDLAREIIKITGLSLSVAGEKLNAEAQIVKGSNISLTVSSNKFSLDPFFALFAAAPAKDKKLKPVPGALTQTLKQAASSIPMNLTINGNVGLKNTSLSRLKIDSFKMKISLKNRIASLDMEEIAAYNGKLLARGVINLPLLSYNLGKIELKGLTATPLINDLIDSFLPNMLEMKNNLEGKLDAVLSVKGSGVEMPSAFDNLEASGIILLADGRIKKIKSLESIGEKYNFNLLRQDMLVRGLRAEGIFSNKKLEVKKLFVQDTDLQVAFSGGLDFNKMEYVKGNLLNLKFSPNVTQDLPKEFSVFRDEKGFVSVDFELQGSLSKPIPSPILTKPIEAVIGKLKVKIEAKKVEIETKLTEEAKQKVGEEKKRLEEEAKKKVKEILKF